MKKLRVKFNKMLKIKKINFNSQFKYPIYTEPLDHTIVQHYTPARQVPENIKRPNYVLNPKIDYSFKEYSIFELNDNNNDLKNFKIASKIAGEAVRLALECIKEGVTTEDVDKVVHDYIISQNAYPSAIGFMGFPKSVCTSVNESIYSIN